MVGPGAKFGHHLLTAGAELNVAARLLSFFRSVAGRYPGETDLATLAEGRTRTAALADLARELVRTILRKS